MSAAAFVAAGYSRVDRDADRSILSYAHEAALDALAGAGIERDEVDGYVGIGSNPNPSIIGGDGADHVSAYLFADSFGLTGLDWVADVSGFAINMAATAAAAIRSGQCSVVLGVRAVSCPGTVPSAPSEHAEPQTYAAGLDQWTKPFGAGAGGTRHGQRLRSYLSRTGAEREDLFAVVAAAREHARNNPVAFFRERDLSLQAYLEAEMVSEPLCLYDCDMPVNGAGAFVMVAGEEARRRDRPAAYLRAHTNWTNAEQVLGHAGLTVEDIDLAQLYDGYSFMVYEWLERLGFCEPDCGWRFVADGRTRPGGQLPVNTFGGALGEGRLHGMGHLREGIVQILGQAGARQVPDAKHCLVQIGPFDRSALAVLSSEPA